MKRTNELFVGIDISEKQLDVAFRDSNCQPVRSDKGFSNDQQGIRNLKETIVSTASSVGKHPKIIVGMEATSNFHKILEKALRKCKTRKMEVHVINPYTIKQFKKMQLKVYKTDKLDAHMIALYLRKMKPKPSPDRYPVRRISRNLPGSDVPPRRKPPNLKTDLEDSSESISPVTRN